MWCGAEGIDCPDCGVFGECYRSACGLPNAEPSKLGTSLINMTVVSIDRQIERWREDHIHRKAMEEFVERLKVKEIERLKNKAKFYYNLAKSYMCDVIYDEELEEDHEK